MWASRGHYDVTRNILNYPDCTAWPRLAASWPHEVKEQLKRTPFISWWDSVSWLGQAAAQNLEQSFTFPPQSILGSAPTHSLSFHPGRSCPGRPGCQDLGFKISLQQSRARLGWRLGGAAMNLHYREGLQLSCFRFWTDIPWWNGSFYF